MTISARLRELGLFDARAPRYTSYPPANHFSKAVGPGTVAQWQQALPAGARVSLYVHIPFCRRLCWFCACRTQGTTTDRPLIPYLDYLHHELALVSKNLDPGVVISQIHLGGGTPTLLSPQMLTELGTALRSFRPLAPDLQFSVEIDPTEVDADRIAALREVGMTRASIGVQDFDPLVQQSIGREQSFETTRDVVGMLRAVGVDSLNMDILYGLPHQTRARITDSVQKVLSLAPDRVALYGYAHVPWMAKRQALIPTEALPGAEERLDLFDTARRLFVWEGYREIGIDHFAREGDSMAAADRDARLKRNFQGYTVDDSVALIGIGASAISRYPQGYAQNISSSSLYATQIEEGRLASERGHALSADDLLRADMIEALMCRFALDLPAIAAAHGVEIDRLRALVAPILARFGDAVRLERDLLSITDSPRLIARLVAQELDAYHMPQGRHSQAL
ncbi:MAG: oxygen-independent coproporphyrinogen III oxidase [Rubellimicrobium sp.]|nr:oxygen-independent coproporphyrinogen III oxidase [Rubellimicrobium sp.]